MIENLPTREHGIVIFERGLQIRVVTSDKAIRLLYHRDTKVEWFYSREDIPDGVLYFVVYGGLNQSKLWDTYDKCSMDVTITRKSGGDSL